MITDSIRQQVIDNIGRKSALFIDQICMVLNAYPKKDNGLVLYRSNYSTDFATHYIGNGYFVISYNALNGAFIVEVKSDNPTLLNYIKTAGERLPGMLTLRNLEDLEKFCETAKFIGGMGDEH